MTQQATTPTWETVTPAMTHCLDTASAKGAQGADVVFSEGTGLSLKSESGALGENKMSQSFTIGIRVIKDQRVGTCYSESIEEADLNAMVDTALTHAKHGKVDELQTIIEPHPEELNSNDAELFLEDNTSLDDKIAMALDLEAKAKAKHEWVKSAPYNGYTEHDSFKFLMTSSGGKCSDKRRSFSCYTSTLLEHGENTGMHYFGQVARKFNELNVDQVVKDSFGFAYDLLDAAPIPTGTYDVVFDPDCLPSFLGGISMVFSGRSAMEGINPWREKVSQSVAANELTIWDRPCYEPGYSRRYFDAEAQAVSDTCLVKHGVLETFYHNSVTSKFFNVPNTCHAQRSPGGTLGVSASQTVIDPGSTADNDVCQGDCFEVLTLQGLHSGIDAISGNFSVGASGYLWRNGKREQCVKEVTLSGNYHTAFNAIAAMGDTLHANSHLTFFAPLIRWSGLSIAGS